MPAVINKSDPHLRALFFGLSAKGVTLSMGDFKVIADKFNELTGEKVSATGMEQRFRQLRKMSQEGEAEALKAKPRAKSTKRKTAKKGDDESDNDVVEPPIKVVKTSASDNEYV